MVDPVSTAALAKTLGSKTFLKTSKALKSTTEGLQSMYDSGAFQQMNNMFLNFTNAKMVITPFSNAMKIMAAGTTEASLKLFNSTMELMEKESVQTAMDAIVSVLSYFIEQGAGMIDNISKLIGFFESVSDEEGPIAKSVGMLWELYKALTDFFNITKDTKKEGKELVFVFTDLLNLIIDLTLNTRTAVKDLTDLSGSDGSLMQLIGMIFELKQAVIDFLNPLNNTKKSFKDLVFSFTDVTNTILDLRNKSEEWRKDVESGGRVQGGEIEAPDLPPGA